MSPDIDKMPQAVTKEDIFVLFEVAELGLFPTRVKRVWGVDFLFMVFNSWWAIVMIVCVSDTMLALSSLCVSV